MVKMVFTSQIWLVIWIFFFIKKALVNSNNFLNLVLNQFYQIIIFNLLLILQKETVDYFKSVQNGQNRRLNFRIDQVGRDVIILLSLINIFWTLDRFRSNFPRKCLLGIPRKWKRFRCFNFFILISEKLSIYYKNKIKIKNKISIFFKFFQIIYIF